jgi:hypothetical protein
MYSNVLGTEYCAVHSAVPTYLRKYTHTIFYQKQNVWLLFRNYRENFCFCLRFIKPLSWFTTSFRHGLYLSIYGIEVNSFWIHWWRRFRTFSYEVLLASRVGFITARKTYTRNKQDVLIIQACGIVGTIVQRHPLQMGYCQNYAMFRVKNRTMYADLSNWRALQSCRCSAKRI